MNPKKRLLGIGQGYTAMVRGVRALPKLKKAIKNEALNQHFKERIMLAVTQVNGCAMCSYAHTAMALEMGMNQEEIASLLGDTMDQVPKEEKKGILFAQHMAEKAGKKKKKVYESILLTYGEETTQGIVAAIYVISLGNAYGIPLGSLKARFNKNKSNTKDERSTLLYELVMLISCILFLPFALVHALLAEMMKRPFISFEKEQKVEGKK